MKKESEMIQALNESQASPGARSIRTAKIIEKNEKTGQVLVMFTPRGASMEKKWAVPALPHAVPLKWGQAVLTACGDGGQIYIIGVPDANVQTDQADTIKLESGARAEAGKNRDKIQVFSKRGSLIFEYDDATGKCRVDVPSGDLEFHSPNGNIDFVSSGSIRMFSRKPVELKSLLGIKLAVSDLLSNSVSFFNLGPKNIRAEGDHMDLKTRSGRIHIDDAEIKGERLKGEIKNIHFVLDRVQTRARDIIQTASNVYHTVENLAQTTAGRLRTLVSDTCQIKSKKMFVKADEDVKIKGDKIHLG